MRLIPHEEHLFAAVNWIAMILTSEFVYIGTLNVNEVERTAVIPPRGKPCAWGRTVLLPPTIYEYIHEYTRIYTNIYEYIQNMSKICTIVHILRNVPQKMQMKMCRKRLSNRKILDNCVIPVGSLL